MGCERLQRLRRNHRGAGLRPPAVLCLPDGGPLGAGCRIRLHRHHGRGVVRRPPIPGPADGRLQPRATDDRRIPAPPRRAAAAPGLGCEHRQRSRDWWTGTPPPTYPASVGCSTLPTPLTTWGRSQSSTKPSLTTPTTGSWCWLRTPPKNRMTRLQDRADDLADAVAAYKERNLPVNRRRATLV